MIWNNIHKEDLLKSYKEFTSDLLPILLCGGLFSQNQSTFQDCYKYANYRFYKSSLYFFANEIF